MTYEEALKVFTETFSKFESDGKPFRLCLFVQGFTLTVTNKSVQLDSLGAEFDECGQDLYTSAFAALNLLSALM